MAEVFKKISPIVQCTRLFRFRCPKTWQSLNETQNENVRFCSVCNRDVHLVAHWRELHKYSGACVAVETDAGGMMGKMGPLAQEQDTRLRASEKPQELPQDILLRPASNHQTPAEELLRAEGGTSIDRRDR